ncbi:rpoB [Symbiodinium sp. CCMP2456]|nr:rpoB [Symbiodinium sp. CCMP2456]
MSTDMYSSSFAVGAEHFQLFALARLSTAAQVPTVRALGLSGIRDPEAIADRLTYLLSASSPPGALRKLREIFRLVGSHDVRLCLRARGWLPKLLSETATLWKQASCLSAESNSSKAADFWRGGIWYSLSADCGAACDILEISLEDILFAAEDHHFALQRDPLCQTKPETASPRGGLLKRRRSGQMVVGASTKSDDDISAVEIVVQRIRESFEDAVLLPGCLEGSSSTVAVGDVSLLVLRRLLSSLSSPSPHGALLGVIRRRLVGCLKTATSAWTADSRHAGVERLALLWETCGLCLRLSPCGPQHCEELVKAACPILQHCMASSDDSPSHLKNMVLKALHMLGSEPQFADMLRSTLCSNRDSLLFLLVGLLGKSKGAAIRLIVGTLAAASSTSCQLCEALSRFHVESSYCRQLCRGLGAELEEHLGDSDDDECCSFAASLARVFATFFFGSFTSEEHAEVQINFAIGGLLLAWLAQGSQNASRVLKQYLGSTRSLVDLLRTFTVFQDHCGMLTDASLISMHKLMTSLTSLPDVDGLSRCDTATDVSGPSKL